MAEAATKSPVKSEGQKGERKSALQEWRPLESLRREIDHLIDNFDGGFWRSPFRRSAFDLEPLWQRQLTLSAMPAVDIVEHDKDYEITAELPGLDESNIDVKVSNNTLTIKGEKTEKKEESKKDYFLSERRYGSFERRFQVPEGADPDKIEATFKKGVLTVTLPKKLEAQKPDKKVAVKTA